MSELETLIEECTKLDKLKNGEPVVTEGVDSIYAMVVRTFSARSLQLVAAVRNENIRACGVQTLKTRNIRRGIAVLGRPAGVIPAEYDALIELQYENAWAPVAVGLRKLYFIAEDGSIRDNVNILMKLRDDACPSVSVSRGGYVVCDSGIVEDANKGGECMLIPDTKEILYVSGADHLLFVTRAGELLCSGDNTRGQCDPSAKSEKCAFVDPIRTCLPTANLRVCGASAGDHHSLFVTDTGRVFAFGDDTDMQVTAGRGNPGQSIRIFEVKFMSKIVQVAAGANHSLALSADGFVYAWGARNRGQLGQGNSGSLLVKIESSLFNKCRVQLIAAGGDGSCAVSMGKLFAWGDGKSGRLGCTSPIKLSPTRVMGPLVGQRVVAVATHTSATIAVTRDGSVFGWGDPDVIGEISNNTFPFKCVTYT